MVRHLQLVVRCVVHGAGIAVLGGRGEKLGAKDLRFLGHYSVNRHRAAVVLLHVGAIQLDVWEALVEGLPGCGGVGVLVLELPRVSLLHHVCRRAEVAGLQILIAHDLRQSGSADAMQSTHHAVGHRWRLGEASLLAHTWVHPGDPVTRASSAATYGCCTLTVGAGHRQVGETRWVRVKRHTAHILTHAHLPHMRVSIAL